jgi:ANTAR domain
MSELMGKTKGQPTSVAAEAALDPGETTVAPDSRANDAVVRRTKDGWRVGSADVPDLTSAMVLADLISAELSAPDEAAAASAAAAGAAATATTSEAERPGDHGTARDRTKSKVKAKVKEAAGTETSKLRTTIGQLEHALTARIRVEQAIGVLAERHRIQPRQAFEQLRNAARNRGRRVIDIATDVVASATNPLLQLPDELSRPRSGARRSRQTRGVLGSE